eukprot:gb/GECH01003953.1/.p1 GENE.gb/GECH01003953.1/~~gb/GECH01003953.1/.p1  ORF type:complete len:172 (+),score=31.13 gb/GECH01003953.1/:1-516(+)
MSSDPEGRVVFISATFLSVQFPSVSDSILENAIFVFGSDRRWVFPANEEERMLSERQPTDYLSFDSKFLNIILQKEREGLVFWLKPTKNYYLVSQFLQTITDPLTNQPYRPLILDDSWWLTQFDPANIKFASPARVVENYKRGGHDYAAVMELLYQSNPTMKPILSWPPDY